MVNHIVPWLCKPSMSQNRRNLVLHYRKPQQLCYLRRSGRSCRPIFGPAFGIEDDRELRPCFEIAYCLHRLIKVLGKEAVARRCQVHRKRRPTQSQGLDKSAHRVAVRVAIAVSHRLDDASSIAGAAAPSTRNSDRDAGHKQFRNWLQEEGRRSGGLRTPALPPRDCGTSSAKRVVSALATYGTNWTSASLANHPPNK